MGYIFLGIFFILIGILFTYLGMMSEEKFREELGYTPEDDALQEEIKEKKDIWDYLMGITSIILLPRIILEYILEKIIDIMIKIFPFWIIRFFQFSIALAFYIAGVLFIVQNI
ncbi:hypothetical protein IM538_03195 [Cytobacillus suaedae]|nr:hypothetical protein IM538_03195 [Cytobacillus suaedae]